MREARTPAEQARPEQIRLDENRPEPGWPDGIRISPATVLPTAPATVLPAADAECQPPLVRSPLLTAKLAVPAPPAGLVRRPRLEARLAEATRRPVTVLAAPAGWGKTVLLSSWLYGTEATDAAESGHDGGARHRPGCPVAWLSVEPEDNGARFWAYLRAALAATGDGYPPAAPAADGTDADSFVPLLADALARRIEPVVLVLDDFHQVADPAVLGGLDFLLRHAAGRLRLVLATRVDPSLPLHRWRLGGELAELRTDDLAFTADETGQLLAGLGLPLPAGQVEEVQTATEGWPAGVRLTGLALAQRAAPAAVPGPSGEADPDIADYLMAEVLAGQPADIRQVLLDTSILGRVCPGLVEALSGRTDGARVLAELVRTNAFIQPLPGPGGWHRYHRMFAALLRAELYREAPARVAALHCRAAGWHEAQGVPAEALRHALAAGAWRDAGRLVAGYGPRVLGYGHDGSAPAPLPAPPAALVRQDPALALALAADRLNRPDRDGAGPLLRLAGRIQQAADADRLVPVAAVLALVHAQRTGDEARVMAEAPRLLAADPADPSAALTLAVLGAAQLDAGDLPAAEETLRTGEARAQRAGMTCARLLCASTLAFVHAARGRLRAAERCAREALSLPACPGQSPGTHRGHAYLALALVAVHRDQLAEAEANLLLAERSTDPHWQPSLAAATAIVRAQVRLEQGELAEGYAQLHAGLAELAGHRPAGLARWFTLAEVDLRISHGDTGTARKLLLALRSEAPELSARLGVALARGHLSDNDPAAAIRALPSWDADPAGGRTGDEPPLWIRLDAGLIEAMAAWRLGEHRRAARALERVLALAEPEGYRRVFTRSPGPVHEMLLAHLDSGTAYWPLVSELVAATQPGPVPAAPPGTGEPLTERELTILRYLQGILSNVEIAAELSLSVNTVKTHVRNIYRKLAANRRREAVRRARELRLL